MQKQREKLGSSICFHCVNFGKLLSKTNLEDNRIVKSYLRLNPKYQKGKSQVE